MFPNFKWCSRMILFSLFLWRGDSCSTVGSRSEELLRSFFATSAQFSDHIIYIFHLLRGSSSWWCRWRSLSIIGCRALLPLCPSWRDHRWSIRRCCSCRPPLEDEERRVGKVRWRCLLVQGTVDGVAIGCLSRRVIRSIVERSGNGSNENGMMTQARIEMRKIRYVSPWLEPSFSFGLFCIARASENLALR